MSLLQYARFLATGGVVGVITVACRELIGWLLGGDDPLRYSISVVSAYAIGIVLSFVINRRYTFSYNGTVALWPTFLRFLGVALSGLLISWLLSLTLRYETSWVIEPGRYSALAAFAIATILSTAVTYPLTAAVVFRRAQRADQRMQEDAVGA